MATTIYPAPTPAGTNNIGDVDVLTVPALVAGNANIGDVDVATLPALAAGSANIGHVDGQGTAGTPAGGVVSVQGVASGTAQPVSLATLPALVAGSANIGDVDVLTLPALPAGTANIGDVDVLTLPALPTGTNNIGAIDVLGDVAHDGVDSGDPVKVGGKASTAAPTAVADADRVNAWFGLRGQLIIRNQLDAARENITLGWDQVATTASESALANFTSGVRAGTALSAANQYTVQSGKVLRIVAVNGALKIGGTSPAAVLSKLRIRQAASSIANTSPIIWEGEIGAPGTANESRHVAWTIPEGIEVAAGQQITFTHIETATGGTSTPGETCTIIGYEYAV
jgi:hypothetical protein